MYVCVVNTVYTCTVAVYSGDKRVLMVIWYGRYSLPVYILSLRKKIWKLDCLMISLSAHFSVLPE